MTDPESTAHPRQRTATPSRLGSRVAVWTCIASFGGFFGTVASLLDWSSM